MKLIPLVETRGIDTLLCGLVKHSVYFVEDFF